MSQEQTLRRLRRVRAKISGTATRPRLSVSRTLKHMIVQAIDDVKGVTLAAASDQDVSENDRKGKTKTEVATLVGGLIAERLKAKGITEVVFDRRDKRYHGRVRAVAEAARAGGLVF